MCVYPKLVKNPKYTANKKNGGVVPAITDNRVAMVPIGCGRCIQCMKQKANNWRIRLLEEVKENKNGIFVTLTFSNESLIKLGKDVNKGRITLEGYELENQICKLAIRRFLERWRKKYKKSIRHWLISELGHNRTERIHLHGILFTNVNKAREEIQNIWNYGYVWTNDERKGYVNEKTINYIIKYCTKTDIQHEYYKPIILCSHGIGKSYVNSAKFNEHKFKGKETRDYYRTYSGHKIKLPIYYRNKAFTDEEKEKLWIEMLNREERYIMGMKIKANDYEAIEKAYSWAQEKNDELIS